MSESGPGDRPATQDPNHPSSDPDYSRLQSEAGHLPEETTPAADPWPEGEVPASDSAERRRRKFDEIDARAAQAATREVHARETSAR